MVSIVKLHSFIATSRSLILIDELGRGTSIEEGVAIAYSVLQYIHNKIQCKTLFATHYREITEIVKVSEMKENDGIEMGWNG